MDFLGLYFRLFVKNVPFNVIIFYSMEEIKGVLFGYLF